MSRTKKFALCIMIALWASFAIVLYAVLGLGIGIKWLTPAAFLGPAAMVATVLWSGFTHISTDREEEQKKLDDKERDKLR